MTLTTFTSLFLEMDSNPNQHCDSESSHSLYLLTTTGFGILQLRRTKWMKRKQIDNLPNKCLGIILNKLTWSQLIHLRVVCKRWRTMIHSMGEEKKLLIVNYLAEQQTNKLKRSFFGALDLANSAPVYLDYLNASTPAELRLASFINSLFSSVTQVVFKVQVVFDDKYPIDIFLESDLDLLSPNITSLSLSLDYSVSTQTLYLITRRINMLGSLNQLELVGHKFETVLPRIVPTIRRLDNFAYINNNSAGETKEMTRIVCTFFHFTRFELDSRSVHFEDISKWRTLNAHWLGQLTHLQLAVSITNFNQLAQFLALNAPSLQVFYFKSYDNTTETNLFEITPQAINDLSRLVHLVQLHLENIFFVESSIDTGQLVNVATCSLRVDVDYDLTCAAFSRILTHILPNVQHLEIAIMCRPECYEDFYDFADYLDRFPALGTYKFVLDDFIEHTRELITN